MEAVSVGDLTVRLAEKRDIAPLDALFARAYPRLLKADYPPSVLVTALPLISKAQPRLVTGGTFFVGEREGRIVSAGGWSQAAPGGRPGAVGLGHVRHVVSDPDHLRQGHARALMQIVMLHAKGSGMGVLNCQSTRTAVPFYASLGFASQGERVIELRPGIGFPAVFMQRAL